MQAITIKKDGQIIAHHTTETSLSHYGQSVWVIEESEPGSGPALWSQGDNIQEIEIICKRGGWLIICQSDKYLAGIIWSDGNYYADLLVNTKGYPCRTLYKPTYKRDRQHIRNTIVFDHSDPDDFGSVLS